MSTATQTKSRAKSPLQPKVPDFCPACDAVDHPFRPVRRKVKQDFRGETLEVDALAMRCGSCGFEIAAPGNLETLRLATMDAYRQRHGLLTSADIVNRRNAMGMSQRAFADHVGVGVASLQRWEKGLLVQDKGSDLLMRARTEHTLFTSMAEIHSSASRFRVVLIHFDSSQTTDESWIVPEYFTRQFSGKTLSPSTWRRRSDLVETVPPNRNSRVRQAFGCTNEPRVRELYGLFSPDA